MNYTPSIEETKTLSRAKVKLLTMPQNRFLAYVLMQLPVQYSESVPTGCTDGLSITLNPSFFMNLTEDERLFLLAHETYHVIFSHMTRLHDRDPHKFNIACDYAINDILYMQAFSLIQGALHDIKYRDMTAEAIYDLLPDSPSDNSNMANDIDYSDPSESEGDNNANQDGKAPNKPQGNIQEQIQSTIQKAALQATMDSCRDSIPPAVQRMLDDLSKPKVNWRSVLRRFMLALDKVDTSWTRPNKRYLHQGMYLPHKKSNKLSKITFALDTSGSVSTSMFNQFVSEVASVLHTLKPKVIELIQFDHELQDQQNISHIQDLLAVEFKGCGGTVPDVAISAFNQSDSKALFIITDGYFDVHHPNPNRPVIWVVFDNLNFKPPYGTAIHFEL